MPISGYTQCMSEKKQSRIKVAIALYYYHPYVSGVSVFAKRVAEGLAQSGYDVTVLTSRYDKTLAKREVINGVAVVRRPVWLRMGKGVLMPTFWLDMIRCAYANDYINAQLPLAESGLAALFIPKRKMVTTYHCDIYLGAGFVDRLITYVSLSLMRLQLWRAQVIVPTTKDYFEHSVMHRFADKAVPVYPPTSTDEFVPLDPAPLFRRLNIPAKTVKIGFVGRIVYEKGINYLLQAIPYLRERLPDFKIVLVGDYEKVAGGSVKDELDEYIAKYPDNILFTGYLDDAERNRFYSGIDVFVLPSIDPLEAFGIVQVEAMLCGAPVVASDLPGVREVIHKTGFGRISKVKDPEDIARQIIEVVTHKEQYVPQRTAVAHYFDAQQAIDGYAALLRKR